MEFIRHLTQLKPQHAGSVATIGNFDGVHLGHQAVCRQLRDKAEELKLPATVILFEPQPQEFFTPSQAPSRLTRLREKLLIMRRMSIERIVCLRFDNRLAETPAPIFIEKLLVQGLGVQYLIVGDDFEFGYKRQGNFHSLQTAGKQYGFEVIAMPTCMLGGERISSTRIRKALNEGLMSAAAEMLGRPYTLCGRIAHGDKRGRTLGFPTANVHLHRRFSPVRGVFAIRMHGVGRTGVPGVANLGTRPTVDGRSTRLLLEAHLFDFSEDIYGRYVEIEFVAKLREEKRFSSFDALQAQIRQDIYSARKVFGVST